MKTKRTIEIYLNWESNGIGQHRAWTIFGDFLIDPAKDGFSLTMQRNELGEKDFGTFDKLELTQEIAMNHFCTIIAAQFADESRDCEARQNVKV